MGLPQQLNLLWACSAEVHWLNNLSLFNPFMIAYIQKDSEEKSKSEYDLT